MWTFCNWWDPLQFMIWLIYRFQISPSWNRLVIEFFNEHKRLPHIWHCVFSPRNQYQTVRKEHELLVVVKILEQDWPSFSKRLAYIAIPEVSVRSATVVTNASIQTLCITTEDRRSEENNCLYKYLHNLFLLAYQINGFDSRDVSEHMIKKIERALPNMVAVSSIQIWVDNFTNGLQ